jgi:hypothetical protein
MEKEIRPEQIQPEEHPIPRRLTALFSKSEFKDKFCSQVFTAQSGTDLDQLATFLKSCEANTCIIVNWSDALHCLQWKKTSVHFYSSCKSVDEFKLQFLENYLKPLLKGLFGEKASQCLKTTIDSSDSILPIDAPLDVAELNFAYFLYRKLSGSPVVNSSASIVPVLATYCSLFRHEHQYRQALFLAERCEEKIDEMVEKNSLQRVCLFDQLSLIHEALGKSDRASYYRNKALALFEGLPLKQRYEAKEVYVELLLHRGDFKKCNQQFQEWKSMTVFFFFFFFLFFFVRISSSSY